MNTTYAYKYAHCLLRVAFKIKKENIKLMNKSKKPSAGKKEELKTEKEGRDT
jgi:hypothetical protein